MLAKSAPQFGAVGFIFALAPFIALMLRRGVVISARELLANCNSLEELKNLARGVLRGEHTLEWYEQVLRKTISFVTESDIGDLLVSLHYTLDACTSNADNTYIVILMLIHFAFGTEELGLVEILELPADPSEVIEAMLAISNPNYVPDPLTRAFCNILPSCSRNVILTSEQLLDYAGRIHHFLRNSS